MRNGRRRSPFLAGNRIVVLLTALMLAAGLTATAAIAGGDATVAKKKKKKCPAGTHKVVKKNKKTGKKKVKCVPNAPTPTPVTPVPPKSATLSISPASVDFGNLAQGGNCMAPPDPDCPTQDFTVTNAGPDASGVPAASIVIVSTRPGDETFQVFANTCTAPIAPGGSCVVTVRAHTPDNFDYVSRLDVTASPGGTASATVMAQ